MKEHSTYKPKSWLKIQPPPPICRPFGKDRSTPTLGVTTQALIGAFWSTHEVLHRTAAHPSAHRILPTQAPRSCRVSPASKLLGAPGSHLRLPSPQRFVVNRCKPRGLSAASMPIPLMTWPPRRPDLVLVLWSKPTKPRMQTSVMSRYPAPAPPWFWGSTKKSYLTSSCFSYHHAAHT
jgi:hypothetical protein